MRAHHLVAAGAAALLAGCSGAGSSGAPVAPISGTVLTISGATFPLSVVVPPALVAESKARFPRYVAPQTRSIVVYDGTAVIYAGNLISGGFQTVFASTGTTSISGASCVPTSPNQTCTVTVSTSAGAHAFDVIAYPNTQSASSPGAIPTATGVILSEGELAVTLNTGTNPGQTITLLGVADKTAFSGPTLTAQLNGDGPLVGVIGTQYTIQYTVEDATSSQIVQPGDYDNGPVTIAETDGGAIVTMASISQPTPPAGGGAQSFTVTCANNGTATITASAKTKPSTNYASGLTYNSSNYASATLGSTTLQCVPNAATLPVTIDSARRAP